MIDYLFDVITKIAWFILVIYVIVIFVRTVREHNLEVAVVRLFSYQVLLPLIAVFALNLLSLALVFIEPQEVGVVISIVSSKGVRERPFSSGLNWIIPLVERVAHYPIYWQTYTMSNKAAEGQRLGDDSIRARTSDGQEVNLDCSLIFRVDAQQVVQVHIDWQERYLEDLVRPVTRGIVRREVAQFKVEEVNSSKRKDLEANLDRLLREQFEDKGFILDQFLLRDISFSPEYAASIEQKQVALEGQTEKEYEARQIELLAQGEAKRIEAIAVAEANAIQIKAEAQANALTLLNQILKENPHLLTYEYIEKLTPQIKVMLLPNDTPFLFPLPDIEEPLTTTLELAPNAPTPTQTITPTLTPAVGQP